MKKIIQTQVPARAAGFRQSEVAFCDICGNKSADQRGNERKCHLCGRDVCFKCYNEDPEDGGDYPDRYCVRCYALKYGTYLAERRKIEEDAYRALESLDARIKSESLSL